MMSLQANELFVVFTVVWCHDIPLVHVQPGAVCACSVCAQCVCVCVCVCVLESACRRILKMWVPQFKLASIVTYSISCKFF